MAARHGTVVTASDCAREEAETRRREGRRRCVPLREAPAALTRWRKAAERLRIGEPELEEGGGMSELGFCDEGRRLRLRWDPVAWGGALNRGEGRGPWHARPGQHGASHLG
jgi:hypothetical protein